MTSILGCDVGWVEVDGFAVDDTDVDEDVDGLPLTADMGVDAAVTEPNILGASDFIGGTEAGEEDIGADASSIEPKVTEEPAWGGHERDQCRRKEREGRIWTLDGSLARVHCPPLPATGGRRGHSPAAGGAHTHTLRPHGGKGRPIAQ